MFDWFKTKLKKKQEKVSIKTPPRRTQWIDTPAPLRETREEADDLVNTLAVASLLSSATDDPTPSTWSGGGGEFSGGGASGSYDDSSSSSSSDCSSSYDSGSSFDSGSCGSND